MSLSRVKKQGTIGVVTEENIIAMRKAIVRTLFSQERGMGHSYFAQLFRLHPNQIYKYIRQMKADEAKQAEIEKNGQQI